MPHQRLFLCARADLSIQPRVAQPFEDLPVNAARLDAHAAQIVAVENRSHMPQPALVEIEPLAHRGVLFLDEMPEFGQHGLEVLRQPLEDKVVTISRYQKRLSGPLLDRIDIHVEVPRVPFQKLSDERRGEPSAAIRARVEAARARQSARFANVKDGQGASLTTNADMGPTQVRDHCPVDETGRRSCWVQRCGR